MNDKDILIETIKNMQALGASCEIKFNFIANVINKLSSDDLISDDFCSMIIDYDVLLNSQIKVLEENKNTYKDDYKYYVLYYFTNQILSETSGENIIDARFEALQHILKYDEFTFVPEELDLSKNRWCYYLSKTTVFYTLLSYFSKGKINSSITSYNDIRLSPDNTIKFISFILDNNIMRPLCNKAILDFYINNALIYSKNPEALIEKIKNSDIPAFQEYSNYPVLILNDAMSEENKINIIKSTYNKKDLNRYLYTLADHKSMHTIMLFIKASILDNNRYNDKAKRNTIADIFRRIFVGSARNKSLVYSISEFKDFDSVIKNNNYIREILMDVCFEGITNNLLSYYSTCIDRTTICELLYHLLNGYTDKEKLRIISIRMPSNQPYLYDEIGLYIRMIICEEFKNAKDEKRNDGTYLPLVYMCKISAINIVKMIYDKIYEPNIDDETKAYLKKFILWMYEKSIGLISDPDAFRKRYNFSGVNVFYDSVYTAPINKYISNDIIEHDEHLTEIFKTLNIDNEFKRDIATNTVQIYNKNLKHEHTFLKIVDGVSPFYSPITLFAYALSMYAKNNGVNVYDIDGERDLYINPQLLSCHINNYNDAETPIELFERAFNGGSYSENVFLNFNIYNYVNTTLWLLKAINVLYDDMMEKGNFTGIYTILKKYALEDNNFKSITVDKNSIYFYYYTNGREVVYNDKEKVIFNTNVLEGVFKLYRICKVINIDALEIFKKYVVVPYLNGFSSTEFRDNLIVTCGALYTYLFENRANIKYTDIESDVISYLLHGFDKLNLPQLAKEVNLDINIDELKKFITDNQNIIYMTL